MTTDEGGLTDEHNTEGTGLTAVRAALDASKFETARRLCLAELGAATGAERTGLVLLLHEALRQLGDFREAVRLMEALSGQERATDLAVRLALGEDYHRLADYTFYRGSEAERSGITGDEYAAQMQEKSSAQFAAVGNLCASPEDRSEAAAVMRRCGRKALADALCPPLGEAALQAVPDGGGQVGTLCGRVRMPDGGAAARVTVVLGLQVAVGAEDPATYLRSDMHYHDRIGALRCRETKTDAQGAFRFADVPAGRHEFVAVRLDPSEHAIATRFLAHNIEVAAGTETRLDVVAAEWQSATPREVPNPWPETLVRDGLVWQRLTLDVLKNPFDYDFPRQPVTVRLPQGVPSGTLRVVSSAAPEVAMPYQRCGDALLYFMELPARSDRVVAVYHSAAGGRETAGESLSLEVEAGGRTAVINTGRASFRIPWGDGDEAQAPLLGVRGPDGVWRGEGRFRLPAGVSVMGRRTRIEEQGALRLTVDVECRLSSGAMYAVQFTAYVGEPCLLAHERSPAVAGGAFEFVLNEFSGGRGFLHWSPENGSVHWTTLSAQDRLLARLQEQTPWWIPPQGFGYAMTADGLAARDYVGVFTIRRGEWVDRLFERVASGPGDVPAERRELDWPYPEMVGSTVSAITAHTTADGDALFRFGLFDGERRWGILVSAFARNDGPFKEIDSVQHRHSSPRLEDFRNWRLDESDAEARPHVVARRADLCGLRAKKASPVFGPIWERIRAGLRHGPAEGLTFAVDGDPAVAWRKKRELVGVARVRCRMTLLGRSFGDMYSPVGGRAITEWAEDYDLIAASGVFTPEEERLVRQFLMLMGHMFMERDFMNWNYNARNANFEADRVDIVGTIGLVFAGNPDADRFVRHGVELMERTLNVYCTPGSGKWYENPSCYYLQALKCRVNFAFQAARRGVFDPTAIPRFKDFMRWGMLVLTPPCPSTYEGMCDAGGDYAGMPKVRRIAPIGDHAQIGPWVPEHFALMSTLYRRRDPEFADQLLWAYRAGGCDGGYFGNLPVLYSALSEGDLAVRDAAAGERLLKSRRLEGFGAAFRGNVGTDREFLLLLKQGPGGYRYHRTEGSFLLFADGKPLVYDGGEAGETWRHSTLSFGPTHMPLAPGHVERFHALPAVEFCQGVHPVALRPGDPVFLSDLCNTELVEVAERRYREPNPADMRSVAWVKDGYVVLHDDLALPGDVESHWHLQVVSEGYAAAGPGDLRFHGRFGTDLQVLLPNQGFRTLEIRRLPVLEYHRTPEASFAMDHLSVDGGLGRAGYLAVLRPMRAGGAALGAEAIRAGERIVGVKVSGAGIRDAVFLSREAQDWTEGDWAFEGRYGQILVREGSTTLVLIEGSRVACGACAVEGRGVAASVEFAGPVCRVVAEGNGYIGVTWAGGSERLPVQGRAETAWSL